jgi:hypothetical protein
MSRLLPHFILILTMLFWRAGAAQDAVPLIAPGDPDKGWTFDYGAEFPGATGGLTVDAEAQREGSPSLKLTGDFTKGGKYVQAGRKIDGVDIRELSLWLRTPDAERITLRLSDSSGQTHQIVLKTEPQVGWQRVVLPLERFFARRGQADAVTSIAKYESWGGAKDGAWHGPAKAIYILLGASDEAKVRTLWLNEIAIVPRPVEAPGVEMTSVVRLDEILDGKHDWGFSNGPEFRGAKGSLTVSPDEPAPGQSSLKLSGDFTGGGAYVAAIKNLHELEAKDVTAFRLRAKTGNAASISVQMVDATGQTHQRKGVKLTSDGAWHDLALEPAKIAGGEHWGGANDGRWHGPPRQLVMSLTENSDPQSKQPVVQFAEIRAETVVAVFVQPAAFKSDFEGTALAPGWNVTGGVALDSKVAFQGSQSLALSRSLENVAEPCSATSPAFLAAPGQWEIRLAGKAELHSPDNSYHGAITLECLDAAGQVVDRATLAELFGKRDWQPISKRVELPKGAVSARFHVQLHKTYGRLWIDDLTAAYLAPAPRRDDRIARVLFSTAQLGNLLFPNDPRRVSLSVETRKPLRDDQRTIACVVRDYWGAEQMRPVEIALGNAEKKGDGFGYAATIDLGDAPLEVGRYYEIHAAIPQAGDEPFRAYTSFAILPEAATKRFKPEEIPFTSRNWDNRITEYIKLSDRLGVRICGLWGGWSSKPPYKAEAPGLDLCAQLGMGWLTTTPCKFIELGKRDYDEPALRQGVRNLIEQFGKVRPMIINLGNEPHGTGERVRANVAAYRAVYEEVKKVDPTIPVVATSVEPNEEYFQLGYGQWCDAFDFHIYETAADVRRTIGEYRALMKKYGVEKPIWSTELGLNSQGQTRHTVAVELIKKFTTFFAAGGANVSWFGLLYPDPDGKDHGSSGNSHNIFDCRFNRYAPRLDAIAYYNGVNAIAAKKFIYGKQYPGGISAFLFRDRDQRSLQVLWKDKGREDVSVPLPGVNEVQVIRIDGSRRTLHAGGKGVTLTISEDPLLLLYDGGGDLAPALGAPLASLEPPPGAVAREVSVTVTPHSDVNLNLVAPPFWTVQKSPAPAGSDGKSSVQFAVAAPANSSVHTADLTVTLRDADARTVGELYWRAPVAR